MRGQGQASMELGIIDHNKYGTRYKKKIIELKIIGEVWYLE
jgi:hypothetical protein